MSDVIFEAVAVSAAVNVYADAAVYVRSVLLGPSTQRHKRRQHCRNAKANANNNSMKTHTKEMKKHTKTLKDENGNINIAGTNKQKHNQTLLSQQQKSKRFLRFVSTDATCYSQQLVARSFSPFWSVAEISRKQKIRSHLILQHITSNATTQPGKSKTHCFLSFYHFSSAFILILV